MNSVTNNTAHWSQKPKLTLDFETYFSTGKTPQGRSNGNPVFSLEKRSIPEYVNDPQFQVHGLAIGCPDGKKDFRFDVPAALSELQQKYGKDFEDVVVVCHNAAFDCYILAVKYDVFPAHIIDTMLIARQRLGVGAKLSLEALAQRFNIGEKGDLSELDGKKELDNYLKGKLRVYAVNDIILTEALLNKLLPYVQNLPQELDIIDHTVKLFTKDLLRLDATITGPVAGKLIIAVTETVAELTGGLTVAQISSDTGFKRFMETALAKTGRTVPMKPGKNGPIPALAKSDKEMQELKNDEDPIIKNLAISRLIAGSLPMLQGRLETMNRIALSTGGKMPVALKYCGAGTGRFSGDGGLNLQNMPTLRGLILPCFEEAAKAAREALHVPDGYKLVAVDACAIEARILSYIARQNDLHYAFANGQDVYSDFAQSVFNLPAGKAKDDSPAEKKKQSFRTIGKQAILGLGYSMGAKRFIQTLESLPELKPLFEDGTLSNLKCKKIVTAYRNKYCQITNFWKDIESIVKNVAITAQPQIWGSLTIFKNKDVLYIQLPSGRRLVFEEIEVRENQIKSIEYINNDGDLASFEICGDDITYRTSTHLYGGKITENIVQAMARDLLVDTILEIEGKGFPVVLHIHDEIICCVPENKAEECLQELINAWRTVPRWAQGLCLDAEGKIGNNLMELK